MTATGGTPGWPHEAPSDVAQALVDMRFVHVLEHGPAVQWQAWQEQRLAALLQWLRQSARWRDWLAPWPGEGGLGRLHALPVMRRADYRSFIEREPVRVPAGFGGIGHTETSGSSGQPVRFAYSALARRLNVNTFAADDQRQGRDTRADTLVVTVQAHPPAGEHGVAEGDPWLHPGRRLIRHSGGYSVEDNARWLCRQQAAHLATYPALLSGMLGAIQRHGLRPPRLRQVITFAETVDPSLREQTQRILGARITDRYSCEEIGPIAFQCPASDHHHHVAVSNAIVEVVDESGHPLPHGRQGSVLVTGLHQWASPAIRYELGDIATLLPHCPVCGVQVPTLTRLLGRRRVLVERASGELVYVRVQAAHWLDAAPGVHEWRMVQTAPRAFDVEVAAAQPLTGDEQAAVQAMLASRIGPEFTFALREVAQVRWPPGRKKQEIVTLG
ncbi:MAG: AMP-binding protein [Burkholderiales bacterium]|jgi:phenylacetate-CoA ligase|nr:AMP-binding protein [Burkholderiales bacterium]